MESNVPEQTLTLKKAESHILVAIIGAFVISIFGAIGTSYAFYYRATDDINDLKSTKVEMRTDIKDLKSNVADIKMSLSNTGIYTDENKDKIKNLEQDVKDMKKQNDEMLKVLYEIKARQRN
jgi:peptidoglycan hydrolase CwlO-like protein